MPERQMVQRLDLHDLARASKRVLALAVPVWFIVISTTRIAALIPLGPPGYDGLLYREASLAWLSGRDPWAPPETGAAFAAPPPSLLGMLPFALLPPEAAVTAIIALGLVGTALTLRRFRMPLWWLAFPPLVDGLWIANPHVLVLPLLVLGPAAIAPLVKLYAFAPLVFGLRVRQGALALVLVAATGALLPWGDYLGRWDEISSRLEAQAAGTGLSVLATPLLIPLTIAACLVVRRRVAVWWLVPVFWPFTQFYYGSLAIPGCTMAAGVIASIPSAPAPAIALLAVAAESLLRHVHVTGGARGLGRVEGLR